MDKKKKMGEKSSKGSTKFVFERDLTKGSKTGMSLGDFLHKKSKTAKNSAASGSFSKVSLSEFIWDRDSGKSWDEIKEKFGLTNDELGFHMIKYDQSKTSDKADQSESEQKNNEDKIDQTNDDIAETDQNTKSVNVRNQPKTNFAKSLPRIEESKVSFTKSNQSSKSGQRKESQIMTSQSEASENKTDLNKASAKVKKQGKRNFIKTWPRNDNSKMSSTKTNQSESGKKKEGQIMDSNLEAGENETGQPNELSLSDFLWNGKSKKSWESIKRKFGLDLPDMFESNEPTARAKSKRHGSLEKEMVPEYSPQIDSEVDTGTLSFDSRNAKKLRTTDFMSEYQENMNVYDEIPENIEYVSEQERLTNTNRTVYEQPGWTNRNVNQQDDLTRRVVSPQQVFTDRSASQQQGLSNRNVIQQQEQTRKNFSQLTRGNFSQQTRGNFSQPTRGRGNFSQQQEFIDGSVNQQHITNRNSHQQQEITVENVSEQQQLTNRNMNQRARGNISQEEEFTNRYVSQQPEATKRKSTGLEMGDTGKRQRMSASLNEGPGNNGKPNPKLFVGNVFMGIKKGTIDRMFENVPGIVSWELRRHKDALARTCIIVEMVSDAAAKNFRKLFHGEMVCNRQLSVRFNEKSLEDDYELDSDFKSVSMTGKRGTNQQGENRKRVILGNVPPDVQKWQFQSLFRFIHGVMSYKLRHHKDDEQNMVLFVEMASEFSSKNLKGIILGAREINGRKLTFRYSRVEDEEIFTGENSNTWEEIRIHKRPKVEETHILDKQETGIPVEQENQAGIPKREAGIPVEQKKKEAVVLISNLPPDCVESDLIDYVSDLDYKSLDFHTGEQTTLKPAYAYVYFNNDNDAMKMVEELHGGLFFGNIIDVKLEYRNAKPEKIAGPKKKIASLLEIEVKPTPGLLKASTPAGSIDDESEMPADNLDSNTAMPAGYTQSAVSAGRPVSSSSLGPDFQAGSSSMGSMQNSGVPVSNFGLQAGTLKTSTGTRMPAGSTGLDLLGSAYGMDIPDEDVPETEQPAGFVDQGPRISVGLETRNVPWSKFMNWTQAVTQGQTTVMQSDQSSNDSSLNTSKQAGILKNTPAGTGMLVKRNAAGYFDVISKDMPSTSISPQLKQLTEKRINPELRNQTGALTGGSDIKAKLSFGISNKRSLETISKSNVLDGNSARGTGNINMGVGMPTGNTGYAADSPARNNGSRMMRASKTARRGMVPSGSALQKIMTPSGIIYSRERNEDQRTRRQAGSMDNWITAPDGGRGEAEYSNELDRNQAGSMVHERNLPAEKRDKTAAFDGYIRPTSIKGLAEYLSGYHSPSSSRSSSSSEGDNSSSEDSGSESDSSPESERKKKASFERKKRRDLEGKTYLDRYLRETEPVAVIGLDYITEYSVPDCNDAAYKCSLCEAFPHGAEIISHLSSQKHRLSYIERRLPALYEKVKSLNLKGADMSVELAKHAREIERRNGRGRIMIIQEQSQEKPILSENEEEESVEKYDVSKDTSMTSDLMSGLSSYKHMETMETEQEASTMALESRNVHEMMSSSSVADSGISKSSTQTTTTEALEEVIELLEEEERPILGLDYVTYQPNALKPEMPLYYCSLCEVRSYLTDLIHHVTGYPHLMEYFKKHCPDVYQMIDVQPTRIKKFDLAQEQARDIETRYGRGMLNFEGWESVSKSQEMVQFTASEQGRSSSQAQDMYIDLTTEEEYETEIIFPDGTETASLSPVDPDSNKAKLFAMLKGKDDFPVVGLRYVTEIQGFHDNMSDSLKYRCELCSTDVSKNLIIIHLNGHQHKTAYIRENYPDTFQDIQGNGGKVDAFCRYIEKQDGREPINVVKLIAPKTLDESVRYTKPIRVRPPGRCTEDVRAFQMATPPELGMTRTPLNVERLTPTAPLTKSYAINVTSGQNTIAQSQGKPKNITGFQNADIQINPPPLPPPVLFSSSVPSIIAPPPILPPPLVGLPSVFATPPFLGAPPPNMQVPPTRITSHIAKDVKDTQIERQMEATLQGTKETAGKMKNFYNLMNEYQTKLPAQRKLMLGLSHITEIQHPRNQEPPLFQCDLCRHSCSANEIIPHIVAKSHQLEFFARKYPVLHKKVIVEVGKAQNELLYRLIGQIESRHRQDRIRRVLAKNDTPWKTWLNNSVTGRFMKTEALIADGIEIESSEDIAGDDSFDGKSSKMDLPLNFINQGSSTYSSGGLSYSGGTNIAANILSNMATTMASNMADKPLQFEVKKATVPAVNVRQGLSMSEIVAHEEVDESEWETIHGEIERRINNQSIVAVQKPSKFLKTYKPFLDKFPVLGLQELTEFQKPDQNIDPWYLCYLCHMKVDWNNVVDHVVTLLHRTRYIEKAHPKLHQILSTSSFECRKELVDKIEEFSKGVAKPPTEFTVKVMQELATTQGQTTEKPERTLGQQRREPRIVFHGNQSKSSTAEPVIEDSSHVTDGGHVTDVKDDQHQNKLDGATAQVKRSLRTTPEDEASKQSQRSVQSYFQVVPPVQTSTQSHTINLTQGLSSAQYAVPVVSGTMTQTGNVQAVVCEQIRSEPSVSSSIANISVSQPPRNQLYSGSFVPSSNSLITCPVAVSAYQVPVQSPEVKQQALQPQTKHQQNLPQQNTQGLPLQLQQLIPIVQSTIRSLNLKVQEQQHQKGQSSQPQPLQTVPVTQSQVQPNFANIPANQGPSSISHQQINQQVFQSQKLIHPEEQNKVIQPVTQGLVLPSEAQKIVPQSQLIQTQFSSASVLNESVSQFTNPSVSLGIITSQNLPGSQASVHSVARLNDNKPLQSVTLPETNKLPSRNDLLNEKLKTAIKEVEKVLQKRVAEAAAKLAAVQEKRIIRETKPINPEKLPVPTEYDSKDDKSKLAETKTDHEDEKEKETKNTEHLNRKRSSRSSNEQESDMIVQKKAQSVDRETRKPSDNKADRDDSFVKAINTCDSEKTRLHKITGLKSISSSESKFEKVADEYDAYLYRDQAKDEKSGKEAVNESKEKKLKTSLTTDIKEIIKDKSKSKEGSVGRDYDSKIDEQGVKGNLKHAENECNRNKHDRQAKDHEHLNDEETLKADVVGDTTTPHDRLLPSQDNNITIKASSSSQNNSMERDKKPSFSSGNQSLEKDKPSSSSQSQNLERDKRASSSSKKQSLEREKKASSYSRNKSLERDYRASDSSRNKSLERDYRTSSSSRNKSLERDYRTSSSSQNKSLEKDHRANSSHKESKKTDINEVRERIQKELQKWDNDDSFGRSERESSHETEGKTSSISKRYINSGNRSKDTDISEIRKRIQRELETCASDDSFYKNQKNDKGFVGDTTSNQRHEGVPLYENRSEKEYIPAHQKGSLTKDFDKETKFQETRRRIQEKLAKWDLETDLSEKEFDRAEHSKTKKVKKISEEVSDVEWTNDKKQLRKGSDSVLPSPRFESSENSQDSKVEPANTMQRKNKDVLENLKESGCNKIQSCGEGVTAITISEKRKYSQVDKEKVLDVNLDEIPMEEDSDNEFQDSMVELGVAEKTADINENMAENVDYSKVIDCVEDEMITIDMIEDGNNLSETEDDLVTTKNEHSVIDVGKEEDFNIKKINVDTFLEEKLDGVDNDSYADNYLESNVEFENGKYVTVDEMQLENRENVVKEGLVANDTNFDNGFKVNSDGGSENNDDVVDVSDNEFVAVNENRGSENEVNVNMGEIVPSENRDDVVNVSDSEFVDADEYEEISEPENEDSFKMKVNKDDVSDVSDDDFVDVDDNGENSGCENEDRVNVNEFVTLNKSEDNADISQNETKRTITVHNRREKLSTYSRRESRKQASSGLSDIQVQRKSSTGRKVAEVKSKYLGVHVQSHRHEESERRSQNSSRSDSRTRSPRSYIPESRSHDHYSERHQPGSSHSGGYKLKASDNLENRSQYYHEKNRSHRYYEESRSRKSYTPDKRTHHSKESRSDVEEDRADKLHSSDKWPKHSYEEFEENAYEPESRSHHGSVGSISERHYHWESRSEKDHYEQSRSQEYYDDERQSKYATESRSHRSGFRDNRSHQEYYNDGDRQPEYTKESMSYRSRYRDDGSHHVDYDRSQFRDNR